MKKLKMRSRNSNKIPVFYHIPKCAGTYVRACHEIILENNLDVPKKAEVIVVFNEEKPILEINLITSNKNKTRRETTLEEFKKEIKSKNLEIFAVSILPDGIKKQKELTQLIKKQTKKNLAKYTIFRNPLDRTVSLYNYIKSSLSNHDKYSTKIKSNSIKQYVTSKELEDCFIIRSLLNLPSEKKIHEDEFLEACKIINEINVFHISSAKKAIKNIFKECYGIKNLKLADIPKNKSLGNKIKLEDLDEKVKSSFLNKKIYDYRLYEKYCTRPENKKTKTKKKLYSSPIRVEKDQCSFNHYVEFEDGEKNEAPWAITHCIKEYLGNLNLKGKRVIDIGAGCGYPSFFMEKMGAEVISHEIPDGTYWDKKIYPNCPKTRKSATQGYINAYWYNHAKFKSENKLFLWDLYKELPSKLGEFDVAVFAMVISHMRDPMLAIMNVLCKTRERAIIVNPFPYLEGTPYAIFSNGDMDWWHPSFQCMREMLLCIGFKIESVFQIKPIFNGEEKNYTSIVFKRM